MLVGLSYYFFCLDDVFLAFTIVSTESLHFLHILSFFPFSSFLWAILVVFLHFGQTRIAFDALKGASYLILSPGLCAVFLMCFVIMLIFSTVILPEFLKSLVILPFLPLSLPDNICTSSPILSFIILQGLVK